MLKKTRFCEEFFPDRGTYSRSNGRIMTKDRSVTTLLRTRRANRPKRQRGPRKIDAATGGRGSCRAGGGGGGKSVARDSVGASPSLIQRAARSVGHECLNSSRARYIQETVRPSSPRRSKRDLRPIRSFSRSSAARILKRAGRRIGGQIGDHVMGGSFDGPFPLGGRIARRILFAF